MTRINVMSLDETVEWLDSKGVRYEMCETMVPVMGNKVACGIPNGIGDEMVDDYYRLPKSLVGVHPMMAIPVQGESMIDADIHEGDMLQTEIGAVPANLDVVVAEVNGEYTTKVYFVDDKGNVWLLPRNKRYKPIAITRDMAFRVSGVVRNITKTTPRCSYSECMDIIARNDKAAKAQTDIYQRLAHAVGEGAHLFWAASAWAVAYCVLRDCCDYDGTVVDFERRAEAMALPQTFAYPCTAGRVQRTLSSHTYMRQHIDRWKERGASARVLVLMGFLRNKL